MRVTPLYAAPQPATSVDGYALLLDDKGSPFGFWFVGAYNTRETAEFALGKQKGNGRIVPFRFTAPQPAGKEKP